ncbi:MAG: hypothetical protein KC912_23515 [Proteobacteria bacterium]|nr:hypothetical protein [Pseudomonadota bacterium]
MIALLLSLTLAPAHAQESEELVKLAQLQSEMAQQDKLYRAGIRMHHIGYGVAAGGFGLMAAGTVMRVNTCSWFNTGPCSPAVFALNRVGIVGYVGGALLTSTGALLEGRALKARGMGGPQTWAYAGLGVAVGTAGVAGLLWGLAESKPDDGYGAVQLRLNSQSAWLIAIGPGVALIPALVQRLVNQQRLRGAVEVAVLPTPLRDGAGLALAGRF